MNHATRSHGGRRSVSVRPFQFGLKRLFLAMVWFAVLFACGRHFGAIGTVIYLAFSFNVAIDLIARDSSIPVYDPFADGEGSYDQ